MEGYMGCEMLRISHCLDNRLTDGSEVVGLTHRQRSTPQITIRTALTTGYNRGRTGPCAKRQELRQWAHSSFHHTRIVNTWWWPYRSKHVVWSSASASGIHFCLELTKPPGLVRPEEVGKLMSFNYLIGSRTCDLPACTIASQPLCYIKKIILKKFSERCVACTTAEPTPFASNMKMAVSARYDNVCGEGIYEWQTSAMRTENAKYTRRRNALRLSQSLRLPPTNIHQSSLFYRPFLPVDTLRVNVNVLFSTASSWNERQLLLCSRTHGCCQSSPARRGVEMGFLRSARANRQWWRHQWQI
jgi:hypothetical protein